MSGTPKSAEAVPSLARGGAGRSPRFDPAVTIGELGAMAVVVSEAAKTRAKPYANAASTLGSAKSRITQLVKKLETFYGPMLISGRNSGGAEVSMNARNLAGFYYVCAYWHRLIQSPNPTVQAKVHVALERFFDEHWEIVEGELVPKDNLAIGSAFKEGLF